jgi:gluconate kinase
MLSLKLQSFLNQINESYIFSDETISVDLHKFENGEVNKLLISGLSGSGKTSTAIILKERYNVDMFDTDSMTKEEIYNGLTNNKKMIISGVGIARRYQEMENLKPILLKQSFVFLGKSALKSAFDGWLRNRKKENNKFSLFDSISDNFTKFYDREMQLKKDRCNIPDSTILPFK